MRCYNSLSSPRLSLFTAHPDMATSTITTIETESVQASRIDTAHDISRLSESSPTVLQPFDAIVDESTPTTTEPQYPTGAKFYIILFSLALILILEGLDESIVSTAVPAITDHFHTGQYAGVFTKPLPALIPLQSLMWAGIRPHIAFHYVPFSSSLASCTRSSRSSA